VFDIKPLHAFEKINIFPRQGSNPDSSVAQRLPTVALRVPFISVLVRSASWGFYLFLPAERVYTAIGNEKWQGNPRGADECYHSNTQLQIWNRTWCMACTCAHLMYGLYLCSPDLWPVLVLTWCMACTCAHLMYGLYLCSPDVWPVLVLTPQPSIIATNTVQMFRRFVFSYLFHPVK
jgi:hypothetical protein